MHSGVHDERVRWSSELQASGYCASCERLSGAHTSGSTSRAAALDPSQRRVLDAGFSPALFAGHSSAPGSPRRAAKAGKSEGAIMKQTGHRSVTVVRRYIRDAELFDDNAAAGIGL